MTEPAIQDVKALEATIQEQKALIASLSGKIGSLERDLKSVSEAHRVKGDRVVQLEAKIVQMASLRTDERLRVDVAALRKDVSDRDKTIDQLLKEASKLREDLWNAEAAKRRAEQRADAFQETMGTMQHARDGAQSERDQAVKRMEAAESRCAELDAKSKSQASLIEELGRIRDQVVKILGLLPPAVRKERDVRVLRALLKQPDEDVQATQKNA